MKAGRNPDNYPINDTILRILEALVESPYKSTDLAKKVDMAYNSLLPHLEKMELWGLIERDTKSVKGRTVIIKIREFNTPIKERLWWMHEKYILLNFKKLSIKSISAVKDFDKLDDSELAEINKNIKSYLSNQKKPKTLKKNP